jgi:hypothetical protein
MMDNEERLSWAISQNFDEDIGPVTQSERGGHFRQTSIERLEKWCESTCGGLYGEQFCSSKQPTY